MAVLFTRPELRSDLAGAVRAASALGHSEEREIGRTTTTGLALTRRVESVPLLAPSLATSSAATNASASSATASPAAAVAIVVLKPAAVTASGVAPAAVVPSTVMPSIAPVTASATTPKRAETARVTVTKPPRRHHTEPVPVALPDDSASSADPYGGGETPVNVPPVTPSTPDPSASGGPGA